MMKNPIIASNHHALYIIVRVKAVGEVSSLASKNVPTAIAAAKTINKIAVKRVENKILDSENPFIMI